MFKLMMLSGVIRMRGCMVWVDGQMREEIGLAFQGAVMNMCRHQGC